MSRTNIPDVSVSRVLEHGFICCNHPLQCVMRKHSVHILELTRHSRDCWQTSFKRFRNSFEISIILSV